MQYKTKLVIILLITNFLFSDSIRFNNLNNHGVVGLINTPTARFYDESSVGLTLYRGDPDRKITLTLMPYDWLEASIFYTSIKGRPYGGGFNQDYKDKGFNAKFRLKSEGNLPAIAVGFNDIAGTGIYSSEYIVASYGIDNLDISLGIGWGVLSGGSLNYDNFLGDIDESFLVRDSEIGQGGELSIDNYFSGKELGIFGGLSYLVYDEWLFKIEYDSTNIPNRLGFPERSSEYNLGLEYIGAENFVISFNFERGDYFGLKFAWKDNSLDHRSKIYKNNDPYEKAPYQKLRSLLDFNEIEVQKISESEDSLILDLYEYNSYSDSADLDSVIKKAIDDSDIGHEEVVIKYSVKGLNAKKIESKSFIDIDENRADILYSREKESEFLYSPNFVLRPFLAGREDFLKVALMAEFNTQYIFNKKLFWSTNLKYALWQNFDDLYIPPVNTYPNQVRSDVKDYLNNFGDRLILGRSQIDYFETLSKNHHIQISAGIFEDMFSGYGMEYLFYKENSNYAFGLELFDVMKRDYEWGFGHLDYENTTLTSNFYYRNYGLIPFDLKISAGEYLAGDVGGTIELSRTYDSGIRFGAFATFTDVSAEDFGEGSFDKGLFFNIPIYGNLISYTWRPLTKDPGAKLLRKHTLHDLLVRFRPIN